MCSRASTLPTKPQGLKYPQSIYPDTSLGITSFSPYPGGSSWPETDAPSMAHHSSDISILIYHKCLTPRQSS